MLHSLNAHPDLHAAWQIFRNLSDVLDTALTRRVVTEHELDDLAPWRHDLALLVAADPGDMAASVGRQILARERPFGRRYMHPLHGLCLGTHPAYAMVWNRVSIPEATWYGQSRGLREADARQRAEQAHSDYRLLQWHVLRIHLSLMGDVSMAEYRQQDGQTHILDRVRRMGHAVDEACRAVRDLSHVEHMFTLSDLELTRDTVDWCHRLAERPSEICDRRVRALRALARRWLKNEDLARRRSHGRRRHGMRAHTTSYEVDYGQGIHLSVPTPDVIDIPGEAIDVSEYSHWSRRSEWTTTDLPGEEGDDESEALCSAQVECVEPQSERDQIMAAVGRVRHQVVAYQHLPAQYDSLTDDEIGEVIRHLESHRVSSTASDGQREVAVFGLAMLWTGSSVERIRKLVVVAGEGQEHALADDVELAYLLATRQWWVRTPRYELAYEPSSEQRMQSRWATDYCLLPDRTGLGEHLPTPEPGKAITKPFARKRTFRQKLADLLRPLTDGGSRVTPERLGRELFTRLITQDDPIYASYITGQPHTATSVIRHYATPRMEKLQQSYTAVVDAMLRAGGQDSRAAESQEPSRESDAPVIAVGAENCPTESLVADVLLKLRTALSGPMESPQQYHNDYVLYVTLMIALTTGYRAVRSIDVGPQRRDPMSGTAFISDKDDDEYYHTRPVWLAPNLLEQLEDYEAHRDYVHAAWEILFDGVRPDRAQLPYLFFVESEEPDQPGMPVPIAPSSAERRLSAYGYDLPLHATRRLLRTALSEAGCPTDVLQTFMGHWRMGQEPHGRYACLSPRRYRATLARHLPPLWERLGLTSVASRWGGRHE